MKPPVDKELIETELAIIKMQVNMMNRENQVRLKNLYELENLVNDKSINLNRIKKTFGSDL